MPSRGGAVFPTSLAEGLRGFLSGLQAMRFAAELIVLLRRVDRDQIGGRVQVEQHAFVHKVAARSSTWLPALGDVLDALAQAGQFR